MAARQKQKDEQKKLKEAQARAAQKGPMGKLVDIILIKLLHSSLLMCACIHYTGASGIKKSGKK